MLSWPAEVLPQLTKPSSSLGWLDQNMITWIASINYIGCMAGSLLAAPLMKVAGPKVLIGCSSLLTSVSWLMVGLSNSPFTLCLSRVCLGCGNAILMASVPSYVATVAPKNCRGALSSCYGLALGLGLIYSVALGITISWSSLSLIASIPSLVLFFSSPFLYNPIKSCTEDSQSNLVTSCQQTPPKVERPLLLFCYLAAMYMLSGVCPLGTFAEMLFTDKETFVASDLILASLACQIVGGLVGAAAIDRLGRKPVLQAGAWLCLLSNILLSLYFSTVDDQHNCPTEPGSVLCWTPAVATCIFFFGFGGGLGNIFFVLLGELVPAESSSTIIPLVTFFLNTLQFIVIKTFMYFANVVGTTNLFFIQAGMNIFFLFGQAAWIPETKAGRESSEDDSSSSSNGSYGTFVGSNVSVNRYSLARERTGEDLEIVLNSTEFVVTINRRE